jgi:hypothetical protein
MCDISRNVFCKLQVTVLYQNNEIEEVKETINAGNKAYANKKCVNVYYYLRDQNLDYTGEQSDHLLHMLVKRGY